MNYNIDAACYSLYAQVSKEFSEGRVSEQFRAAVEPLLAMYPNCREYGNSAAEAANNVFRALVMRRLGFRESHPLECVAKAVICGSIADPLLQSLNRAEEEVLVTLLRTAKDFR